MEVKVYYLKNAKGQIYGIQMIDLLGDHCEIHSHPTNLDGLWSYDTQIYGTCDFNEMENQHLKNVAILQ